ncbi:MAG: alanine dehydrogenase [bacterium]
MTIGIPREISIEETRVAVTPAGVYELTAEGHRVYVETGCGISSGFSDQDYLKVGGEIVYSHDEIFGRADTLIKVEPPTEEETEMMVEEQTLFSSLHLGIRTPKSIQKLMKKKITAVGYELMKIEENEHSVMDAMGGIAGAMLPQIAGRLLELHKGGRGVLLSAQPGIPSASIVILGAGHVGVSAIKAFLGLGAQVMVLDRDLSRLRRIDELTNKRAVTALATPYNIEKSLRFADVFIGAVFIRGEKPPRLVTKEMIKKMRKSTVIMDISIDQGGCIETSRPTTHSDSVFVEEGIIHYCVPNIPSAVPRTASHALSNVVFPYVMETAELGIEKTIKSDSALKKGVYLIQGECTDKSIEAMFL